MKGYNATIMAYGQTGSGKTFTMGSNFGTIYTEFEGIIPKVIRSLLDTIRVKTETSDTQFMITSSFVEIYNEEIYDLLNFDGITMNMANSGTARRDNAASLRDDKDGSVMICGVKEIAVQTEEELFILLERGAKKRATGSTLMNNESSRSHA